VLAVAGPSLRGKVKIRLILLRGGWQNAERKARDGKRKESPGGHGDVLTTKDAARQLLIQRDFAG
jgi:hypothetical protein